MARKIQLITIEGNIGSGKSTLLENVCKHYLNDSRVIFLKEPVSEWETIKDANGVTMLQKFYADQKKYSFPFQMMAYITRLVLLKTSIEENPNATVFFTERSLYTDKHVFAKMLYDTGNIEDVNYQIYMRWFDAFSKDFTINNVIYVKTDPEICHHRIHMRSREGEDIIPLEYLQNCHKYHETLIFDHFANVKTLLIDGNADIRRNPDIIHEWLHEIEQLLRLTPLDTASEVQSLFAALVPDYGSLKKTLELSHPPTTTSSKLLS
jgi:deoxyadenosine/deoxycytidine kinase